MWQKDEEEEKEGKMDEK
jgi:hypothetical protein